MNMHRSLQQPVAPALSDEQSLELDKACEKIAPSWPLDRMIAVNPLWEQRQADIREVAARLKALRGVNCLMPASHYESRWEQGITHEHLARAAREYNVSESIGELVSRLRNLAKDGSAQSASWKAVSDLLDAQKDLSHEMPWRTEITHQISQFCAHFFQAADQRSDQEPGGLYQEWLSVTRRDRGIAILMREPSIMDGFKALPESFEALLAEALGGLGVTPEQSRDTGEALLLSINGWASWVALLRWENRLQGSQHDLMRELLAIRLAWEWVLWQHVVPRQAAAQRLMSAWRDQQSQLPALIQSHRDAQQLLWVWQRADELAYQQGLHERLLEPAPKAPPVPKLLQAAFCIDVRSEVYRRALEAQHPGIQTLGFAGFFGIPMQYSPADTPLNRAQLPGLLAPALRVCESGDDQSDLPGRAARLNRDARWQEAWRSPTASFSLVESAGILKAFNLLRDSWFPSAHRDAVGDLAKGCHLQLEKDGKALSATEKAELAYAILNAMTLKEGFAKTVLLVGHGSHSRNNPHAASLDCGACGGQTGELNVRVLAALLNELEVREALALKGLSIPSETRFVPALHNTTTDELEILDGQTDNIIQNWLRAASHRCRVERSEKLGIGERRPEKLLKTLVKRSRDWSELRPEWGLANNAAFIVAPRQRTRHLNLDGRAFLHDYDFQNDEGYAVLELILTAPMIVTHWINMQYNLSTSDNGFFGSGNKMLHNVVGGRLGVFEGNGGDLRIGLSLQSVNDGKQNMHDPLRLNVYVDAPADAIQDIVNRHENVRCLVDNEWLYLFRVDNDKGTIQRLFRDEWHTECRKEAP